MGIQWHHGKAHTITRQFATRANLPDSMGANRVPKMHGERPQDNVEKNEPFL